MAADRRASALGETSAVSQLKTQWRGGRAPFFRPEGITLSAFSGCFVCLLSHESGSCLCEKTCVVALCVGCRTKPVTAPTAKKRTTGNTGTLERTRARRGERARPRPAARHAGAPARLSYFRSSGGVVPRSKRGLQPLTLLPLTRARGAGARESLAVYLSVPEVYVCAS